jgi:hypothetical protein
MPALGITETCANAALVIAVKAARMKIFFMKMYRLMSIYTIGYLYNGFREWFLYSRIIFGFCCVTFCKYFPTGISVWQIKKAEAAFAPAFG